MSAVKPAPPRPTRGRTEVLVAIDAGTTGVRSLAFELDGSVAAVSYRELTQHYPRPGWVEHDPAEIWNLVQETLGELITTLQAAGRTPLAIGITNQRETAVAWDRRSGRAITAAIVWQDRRTADRCAELQQQGLLRTVREQTGLVLDPYFTATKWEWMLRHGGVQLGSDLALGTVDSWVLWNLTGGVSGGVHATDPSNASRTLLYDIGRGSWSSELCEIFGLPVGALAEVRPSARPFGVVGSAPARGLPVTGIAGDQQASLFGHGCRSVGDTKVTYGTGSFVLSNIGTELPAPTEGLLTTIAWDLGDGTGPVYALEGAVFASGAAIQWMRDGLGLIGEASEIGPLAGTVPDAGGCYMVPAFSGLGSPWWDPHARAAIVGLTRGVGRAHLARAIIESIAFQTRDVVDAMATAAGRAPGRLLADGGASAMDLLLQLQADQCGVPVTRQASTEVTALGAAALAGLGAGIWDSAEELGSLARQAGTFSPVRTRSAADADHQGWLKALDRSREWELSS